MWVFWLILGLVVMLFGAFLIFQRDPLEQGSSHSFKLHDRIEISSSKTGLMIFVLGLVITVAAPTVIGDRPSRSKEAPSSPRPAVPPSTTTADRSMPTASPPTPTASPSTPTASPSASPPVPTASPPVGTGPWTAAQADVQLVVERLGPDTSHERRMRIRLRLENNGSNDYAIQATNVVAVDNYGQSHTVDAGNSNMPFATSAYSYNLHSGETLLGEILLADSLAAGVDRLDLRVSMEQYVRFITVAVTVPVPSS